MQVGRFVVIDIVFKTETEQIHFAAGRTVERKLPIYISKGIGETGRIEVVVK